MHLENSLGLLIRIKGGINYFRHLIKFVKIRKKNI